MDSTHSQRAIELLQAQVHVYNHIFNYINSMSLKCGIELRIPDIIHNHGMPITLPELAAALQINPAKTNSLYRLMRVLVHSGFFSTTQAANKDQEGQEAYALTPSSVILVNDDNPNCLAPFVNSMLMQDFITSGHFLSDWFRGDESTVFQKAHGIAFWEYNERNPEFNQFFNEAMASDSRNI